MSATSQNHEKFNDYEGFVEKFKPKKTTDDCYTPENIYQVVKDWACERYDVDPSTVVRPFYPGGDYESEDYSGKVVIDNPPFSILSKIIRFYQAQGVPFFLFCPGLTMLKPDDMDITAICADTQITYENGAVVRTGFITNMDDEYRLYTAPDLMDSVDEANTANIKARSRDLPVYQYPFDVLTSARANWMCRHHTEILIKKSDARFIRKLDMQSEFGKSIFGGGLLLSESATSERAAAEMETPGYFDRPDAIHWELSDRERDMQKSIEND